ncbi:unnamed protein product [Musa hybrid cultivar]
MIRPCLVNKDKLRFKKIMSDESIIADLSMEMLACLCLEAPSAGIQWSCLIIAFQVLKLKAIQVTVPLPRDQLPPCLKSPILVVGGVHLNFHLLLH